jgi:CotS family spore coat protein
VGSIFERHNRELKKIYKYISGVKRKNDFEKLFLQEFQGYYEQGQYCLNQHRHSLQEVSKNHYGICHGACNQHNIILGKVDALVHFERFTKGNQLNDLYQFTRKAMEKNHFELELLTRLLLAYDEVISLSKEDYRYIYILFSYPEKFWKIANGYYNTNKAFLSPKYVEKLQNVIWQEEEKREMLKEYFAFHLQ